MTNQPPIIVPSFGQTPNPIMIIGEAPGRYESNIGRPFVGPSGDITEMILAHCGMHPPYLKAGMFLANLVPEYHDGNPDPTNEQIVRWSDQLRDEIKLCQPKVILAVGRFAAWWLLGGWHKWSMRDIHGRPCRGGELVDITDISRYPEWTTEQGLEEFVNFKIDEHEDWFACLEDDYHNRACGAIVVPCFHPANALPDRDPKGDMMAVVWKDFDVAIRIHEILQSLAKEHPPEAPLLDKFYYTSVDDLVGIEDYIDATGQDVSDYIDNPAPLAIDTEDGATSPWSIQVCNKVGYALTLRTDQPDFDLGIAAIQRHIDANGLVILHFALHDLPVMRELGLDTSNINLVDTSYMLYLLNGPGYEPQALKIAMWRHCGMTGDSYMSTVGDAGRSSQLRYLLDVVLRFYSKPDACNITLNNGQSITYSPQSPSAKAERMIKDMSNGMDVDIWDRWHNISGSGQRAQVVKAIYHEVEEDLGAMPRGYLSDVYDDKGRGKAIRYASRDPDGTLRLYLAVLPKLVELGLA